jgi:hypothetical protein
MEPPGVCLYIIAVHRSECTQTHHKMLSLSTSVHNILLTTKSKQYRTQYSISKDGVTVNTFSFENLSMYHKIRNVLLYHW